MWDKSIFYSLSPKMRKELNLKPKTDQQVKRTRYLNETPLGKIFTQATNKGQVLIHKYNSEGIGYIMGVKKED